MKSEKTIEVNKITGKTISEMSWDEIRGLKGHFIDRTKLLDKIKQTKS